MDYDNWVLECKNADRIWQINASGERNDEL